MRGCLPLEHNAWEETQARGDQRSCENHFQRSRCICSHCGFQVQWLILAMMLVLSFSIPIPKHLMFQEIALILPVSDIASLHDMLPFFKKKTKLPKKIKVWVENWVSILAPKVLDQVWALWSRSVPCFERSFCLNKWFQQIIKSPNQTFAQNY